MIKNNRIQANNVNLNDAEEVEEVEEAEEEEMREIPQSIVNETAVHPPNDDHFSTTISKGPSDETIAELSTIERMETTTEIDHPSTLLISTADDTTHHESSARPIVLTASSLEDYQKVRNEYSFSIERNEFSLESISSICLSIWCFNKCSSRWNYNPCDCQ